MKRAWIFTLLLFTFLSACSHVNYQKAIVDVSDVQKAINIAKELDGRNNQSPPDGLKWFEIRKGAFPVIVTAPHSTQPFREGKYRFSDGGGTAGLAVAIHDICNITVLYTTYPSPSDPNFYDDNEFKAQLGKLIVEIKPTLLLDIHASHPYRPYEVDLGTMNGLSVLDDKDLIPALLNAFKNEGLVSTSVDWFAASDHQTVTKYASSRGVPSVQLEFSATRMLGDTNDFSAHRFAQALQAVAEFLRTRGLCARIDRIGTDK
jgi:hypothetical protein